MSNTVPSLHKDAHISFPPTPLEIDFVFCEHGSPTDLPSIFGDLAIDADIIALEVVGWTEQGKELRQNVSDGHAGALETLSDLLPSNTQGDFWRALHKKIYKSNANIHYPEAPQGDVVATRYVNSTQKLDEVISVIHLEQAGNYGGLGSTALNGVKKVFGAMAAREKYVLEHLFPQDIEMSEGVSPLQYVAMFGLLHRNLASTVRAKAEEQGRTDIIVRQHESGLTDPTSYENYLQGIPPTLDDLATILSF